jgi:hypothetical protein
LLAERNGAALDRCGAMINFGPYRRAMRSRRQSKKKPGWWSSRV